MINRLFLVQYEDDETGEERCCLVTAPNPTLAAAFIFPCAVLRVAYIDDTGVGHDGVGGAGGDELVPAGDDPLDALAP